MSGEDLARTARLRVEVMHALVPGDRPGRIGVLREIVAAERIDCPRDAELALAYACTAVPRWS